MTLSVFCCRYTPVDARVAPAPVSTTSTTSTSAYTKLNRLPLIPDQVRIISSTVFSSRDRSYLLHQSCHEEREKIRAIKRAWQLGALINLRSQVPPIIIPQIPIVSSYSPRHTVRLPGEVSTPDPVAVDTMRTEMILDQNVVIPPSRFTHYTTC